MNPPYSDIIDDTTAKKTGSKNKQEPKIKMALFFADLSGFTHIVSSFSKKGREGMEEIAKIVSDLYGTFIQAYEQNGGFFINAAGDSVLISLPFNAGSINTVKEVNKNLTKIIKSYISEQVGLKSAFICEEFVYTPYFWKNNYLSVISGKAKETLSGLDLADGSIFFYPLVHHPDRQKPFSKTIFTKNISVIKNPEHRVVVSMMIQSPAISVLDLKKYIKKIDYFISAHNGEISDIDCINRDGFKTLVLFGHRSENISEFEEVLECAQRIIQSNIFGSNRPKIGISAGYAYTGILDIKDKSKFMAIGDDINLSERLTRIGSQGDIYFSDKFKRLLSSKIKCLKSRSRYLPKYPEKIDYYRFESYSRPVSVFIDRNREMRSVISLLDKGCRSVHLKGDSGIGKSALLSRLSVELNKDYKVVFIRKEPGETPLFLSDSASIELGYNKDFQNISSLPQSSWQYVLQDRIINSMRKKFPFALLIDDAEFKRIDMSIVKAIQKILGPSKSVLIISSKPNFSYNGFGEILITPLKKRNTQELLSSGFGGRQIDNIFLDYVMEKSKGNPLFSLMLINHLENFGYLKEEKSKIFLRKQPEKIPENLAFVSMAKFNLMRPEMKRALKFASIAGYSFSPEVIKELTGDQETSLYLSQAAAEGILEIKKDICFFTQQFFKDALYESILSKEKKQTHEKIAEILSRKSSIQEFSPGETAYHFHMAGNKSKAMPLYFCAIGKAVADKKSEEALGLIKLAEEITDNESEIYFLYKNKAEASVIEGNFTLYDFYINKCVARAKKLKNKEELARLYTSKGMKEYLRLDTVKSIKYFKKAMSFASGDNLDTIYMHMSDVNWRIGMIEESEKYLLKLEESISKKPDSFVYPDFLHKKGLLAYARGQMDEALFYLKQALNLDTGLFFKEFLCNDIAEVYYLKGKTAKAIEFIKKSMSYSKKIGYVWSISYSLLNYSIFLSQLKRYSESLKVIEKCLKMTDIVYPQINTIALINRFLINTEFSSKFDPESAWKEIKGSKHYKSNSQIKVFADYAWAVYLKKSSRKAEFNRLAPNLLRQAKKINLSPGSVTGIYIDIKKIEDLTRLSLKGAKRRKYDPNRN
ncbi:hypothetical protein JW890_06295 [candidate division WOR-3 bacterium]|nr:hypothetical protein [candidate division WOR-3 bacterium]